MESERHYPTAYKLASVALMGFAVWIFHQSHSPIIKAYALIEFVATLNGWAASENENNTYGDLFLLNDAFCSALFFLTMLDLSKGIYNTFYIYSTFLFGLYYIWNELLISTKQAKRKDLSTFQICNTIGFIYSCAAAICEYVQIKQYLLLFMHMIGIIMWLAILSIWFLYAYFDTSKAHSSTENTNSEEEIHENEHNC